MIALVLAAPLASAGWNGHDTFMTMLVLGTIAAVVLLIAVLKLPPFLGLTLGALIAGVGAGLPLAKLIHEYGEGAGSLLGHTGMVIALGAMFGALIASSGAADRLAQVLLGKASDVSLPWRMTVLAVLIGLPVFFEVGLVMMMPVIFAAARQTRQPILRVAVPAMAALSSLHALLPPHPGPLIVIHALHANFPLTMALGFGTALITATLAGPVYGNWISRRIHPTGRTALNSLFDGEPAEGEMPSAWLSLLVLVLPIILMLGQAVAAIWLAADSPAARLLDFLGDPLLALTVAVLAATLCFGWMHGQSLTDVGQILQKALPPIAGLLLTIGAGGALKQVLVTAGASEVIAKVAAVAHLPLVLTGWLISVAFRQATGSATVAGTTAAGLMAPLLASAGLSATQVSLVVLAIGSGSVFFSHVNDPGFWMVREYLGLKLGETVAVWSVLQTIIGLVGLLVALGLSVLLP